jgi:hypothetical protein
VISTVLRLLEDNPYVCVFRSLGNVANLDEYRIELYTDIGVDQRRYNAPTIFQVAAIWERKGVMLQNNLRGALWFVAPLESHNISKHITDVTTLFRIHYFFPRGEAGWNKKILYADQGGLVEGLCVSL